MKKLLITITLLACTAYPIFAQVIKRGPDVSAISAKIADVLRGISYRVATAKDPLIAPHLAELTISQQLESQRQMMRVIEAGIPSFKFTTEATMYQQAARVTNALLMIPSINNQNFQQVLNDYYKHNFAPVQVQVGDSKNYQTARVPLASELLEAKENGLLFPEKFQEVFFSNSIWAIYFHRTLSLSNMPDLFIPNTTKFSADSMYLYPFSTPEDIGLMRRFISRASFFPAYPGENLPMLVLAKRILGTDYYENPIVFLDINNHLGWYEVKEVESVENNRILVVSPFDISTLK